MDGNDFNSLTQEEMQELVARHAQQLIEYFDAVQILVSLPGDGGTASIFTGRGNWFARQGMAHDFIKQDQARTDANELAKVICTDD